MSDAGNLPIHEKIFTESVQRWIVEGLEDRKIYICIILDIVVSVCADVAGAETQDGGTAAEPADMTVAVSGHSDRTDMASASRCAHADGGFLYRQLKARGVLVRHFDTPRIKDYLRITIGAPEQMEALFEKLEEILSGTDVEDKF